MGEMRGGGAGWLRCGGAAVVQHAWAALPARGTQGQLRGMHSLISDVYKQHALHGNSARSKQHTRAEQSAHVLEDDA